MANSNGIVVMKISCSCSCEAQYTTIDTTNTFIEIHNKLSSKSNQNEVGTVHVKCRCAVGGSIDQDWTAVNTTLWAFFVQALDGHEMCKISVGAVKIHITTNIQGHSRVAGAQILRGGGKPLICVAAYVNQAVHSLNWLHWLLIQWRRTGFLLVL
jgi:hypothetical protein